MIGNSNKTNININYVLMWVVLSCLGIALITGLTIYFYDVSPQPVAIKDNVEDQRRLQAIYLLPKEKHADEKYRLNDFLSAASIDRGVKVVVSPARRFVNCIDQTSKKIKGKNSIKFISVYDDVLRDNSNTITFKVQLYQIYYLSGIIAASISNSEHFIFTVPELNGDSYRNINAFTLGVRKYKKNGMVHVVVLSSTNEHVQYAKLTQTIIRYPDISVMAAEYTDVTVDEFCEQKVPYCIRYDRDFASKYFLSTVGNIQVDYRGFFSRSLSRIISGSFEAGNYLLNISNGSTRIGSLNADVISPNVLKNVDLIFNRFMISDDNIFSGPVYDNEHHLRLDKGSALRDRSDQMFSMDWLVEGTVVEKL